VLPASGRRTLYARTGDWALVSLLVLGALPVAFRLRWRPRRDPWDSTAPKLAHRRNSYFPCSPVVDRVWWCTL